MARKRSNSSHWSSMSIDIDRHRDRRHTQTRTRQDNMPHQSIECPSLEQ